MKSSSAGSSRGGSGSGTKSKPSSASSDSGKIGRPSDKLNPKTCDPFDDKHKNSSTFAAVYSNGGIPCRLVHGSVKHKLAWSTPPESVPFDPILVTLAEGLKEVVHPYAFVAKQGFVELLDISDAGSKALPLLAKLAGPLRTALSHTDGKVFEAAMEALQSLSGAVKEALNPHLKHFLVPLAKRLTEHAYRDSVNHALNILERNGGKDSAIIIKSKIPTYTAILA